MHHFVHQSNKTKREYDYMVRQAERIYRKGYRNRLRQEIERKEAEYQKAKEKQGKSGRPSKGQAKAGQGA